MGIGLCTQSEVKNAMLYGNLFAVFAVVGGIEIEWELGDSTLFSVFSMQLV